MIKYAYEHENVIETEIDKETLEEVTVSEKIVVRRHQIDEFRTVEEVKARLGKEITPVEVIKEQLLHAKVGVAEQPLIEAEDEWFKLYTKIEGLKQEVVDLKAKLEESDEVGVETINARIKDLEGYQYSDYNGPRSSQQVVTVTGEISEHEDILTELETKRPWLLAYRGEEVPGGIERPDVSKFIRLYEDEVKGLIRHERDFMVRDAEQSIGDIAKMTSLSFSVISMLWKMVPDEAKDELPEDKRKVVDYAIGKFDQIETRADRQLAAESTAFIDKLYNREVEIADIIDKHRVK